MRVGQKGNRYNVYKHDKLILENVRRRELDYLNDGKKLNCSLYASKGYLLKEQYLIVRLGKDGEEIRVEKKDVLKRRKPNQSYRLKEKHHITMEEIIERCREFSIGDNVIIKETEYAPSGKKEITSRARIIGRYPSGLLLERERGVKEMFTYSEIVLEGVVAKL